MKYELEQMPGTKFPWNIRRWLIQKLVGRAAVAMNLEVVGSVKPLFPQARGRIYRSVQFCQEDDEWRMVSKAERFGLHFHWRMEGNEVREDDRLEAFQWDPDTQVTMEDCYVAGPRRRRSPLSRLWAKLKSRRKAA